MILVVQVGMDGDIFMEIWPILELFVGMELGTGLKSSHYEGTANDGTSSLFCLGMELWN